MAIPDHSTPGSPYYDYDGGCCDICMRDCDNLYDITEGEYEGYHVCSRCCVRIEDEFDIIVE